MALGVNENKLLNTSIDIAIAEVFAQNKINLTPEIKSQLNDIFKGIDEYSKADKIFHNTKDNLKVIQKAGINVDFNTTGENGGFVNKDVINSVKKEMKHVLSSKEKAQFEEIVGNKLGNKPELNTNSNSVNLKNYNLKRSELYRDYIKTHGKEKIVLSKEEKIKFEELVEKKIGKNTGNLSSQSYIEKRGKLYKDYVNGPDVGKKIYAPIQVEQIQKAFEQKMLDTGQKYNKINFKEFLPIEEYTKNTNLNFDKLIMNNPQLKPISDKIAALIVVKADAVSPTINALDVKESLRDKLIATTQGKFNPYKEHKATIDPEENKKLYANQIKKDFKNKNDLDQELHQGNANIAITGKLSGIKSYIENDAKEVFNEAEVKNLKSKFEKITQNLGNTEDIAEKFNKADQGIKEFKVFCEEKIENYEKLSVQNSVKIDAKSTNQEKIKNILKLNFKDFSEAKELKNNLSSIESKRDNLISLKSALTTSQEAIAERKITEIADSVKTAKSNMENIENKYLKMQERRLYIQNEVKNNEKAVQEGNIKHFINKTKEIAGLPIAVEPEKNITIKNLRLAGVMNRAAPGNRVSPLSAQSSAPKPLRSSLAASTVKASEIKENFTKAKPSQNLASGKISTGSHRNSSSAPAKLNLPDQPPPPIFPKPIHERKSAPPPIPAKPISAKDNEQNIATAIKNNLEKLINTNYKTADGNEKNQIQANKLSLKTIINASPHQGELLVNLQSFSSGLVKGSNEVSKGIREVLKSGAQALKQASDGNIKESTTTLKLMNEKTNEIVVKHGKIQNINKVRVEELKKTAQKKFSKLSALADKARAFKKIIENAVPSKRTAPKTEINQSKMR